MINLPQIKNDYYDIAVDILITMVLTKHMNELQFVR